ncbi:methyl-accepting chemotaxis protein [Alteromonas sp. ASW11-19]|uniref:Methyl-accepting chemotaxis protein n=1 Tax=Alteromonas salexigens TaxID=2982530 RepID=A0ABT2VL17_9ALTE|nr:methyl-accepting chemotaxis protein [Alteromonas salexigens]MCU7554000.1 methyl-accepting chemotaxis protein [Alteromonas salexigens]
MQLNVVNKISLGFALFGCLLLLTSILSYFGLSDIRQSAVDVVDNKMPVQSTVVSVKTEILSLATITANGYHVNSLAELQANRERFESLAEPFLIHMNQLQQSMTTASAAQSAIDGSKAYVAESNAMYTALEQKLRLIERIAEQLEGVLMSADEASALMLDLSYLEADGPGIQTLIGAGTNIDNKLLTMNTAIGELAATNDETATQNIVADLEYQFSNLKVDKDYLNRLAEGVDDGGTVAAFNNEYQALITQLTGDEGLISLQQSKLAQIAAAASHRDAANQALENALADINGLFQNVSQSTLAGQNEILQTVQENLVRNLIVAVTGLLAAVVLAVFATRSIARPLTKINRGLTQLSQGDLTTKLDQSGKDEFAVLAARVNSLTDSLRELVGNILEQEIKLMAITKESVSLGERSLRDVDAQRQQVQTTSKNTQVVQDTSRSNLTQINVAMEELHTVTEQSRAIADLVADSRRQVDSQAKQAETSATVIHRLEENSSRIGSILDVIKTIAEQTNLLALNAAIEAARAGEQGRGFAVVADEVRTLANRTHASTEEIETMIDSLQQDAKEAVGAIETGRQQANQGVEITRQVSEQVEGIRHIIVKLSQINQDIVKDTREQDGLLADVATSLTTIVELAESSANSTRQANQSTAQLDEQMESLKRAVERFQL